MAHTAYDSIQLLENTPKKITAIEHHKSTLFIACSDGSLLIYIAHSSSSSSSIPSPDQTVDLDLKKEQYVLEKTLNAFSKKQMLAMKVLASRELLLSLSETIVIHRLPNLETQEVFAKAKGANVYAWDDVRGFLCFARQKRVCVFRHNGTLL